MTGRSAELARREISHIEATPALPGIGAVLDQYMWVHTISHVPMTDLMTGRRWQLLTIQGIIKPDLEAPDASSLRRGFLESFEAIVAVLDEAGAKWGRHPEFVIGGKVCTEKDGLQSFREVEANVCLELRLAWVTRRPG